MKPLLFFVLFFYKMSYDSTWKLCLFLFCCCPCPTQKASINYEENLLDTGEITPYSILEEIHDTKEPFDKLWSVAVQFHHQYDKWMNGPLLDVDAEKVEEEVTDKFKFLGIHIKF